MINKDRKMLVNLYYGYIKENTIDANLHPQEQINALVKILTDASLNDNTIVDIYCNSTYVINNMIVIQAYSMSNIPKNKKLYQNILPFENKHFEIKENGKILEGQYYKGMISDENLLNDYIGKSNDDFSDFLGLSKNDR